MIRKGSQYFTFSMKGFLKMGEKEILIQNITNAMSAAKKMEPLEMEMNKYEAIINVPKKKKNISLFGFLMGYLRWVFVISLLVTAGMTAVLTFMAVGGLEFDAAFMCLIMTVILGLLAYIVGFRKIVKKILAKKRLPELQREHAEISSDDSLSWLPEEYRTFGCINAINRYVNTGRADTLKEALNLVDLEIHRDRMQNAAFAGAYSGIQNMM